MGITRDLSKSRTYKDSSLPNRRDLGVTLDRMDCYSLTPLDVEEQLISLLEAGFPVDHRHVVEKLRKLKEIRLKGLVRLIIRFMMGIACCPG